MDKVRGWIRNRNILEDCGIIGVYLFALSVMISKAGMNVGLALMILSSIFYIKKIEIKKMETEQKLLVIALIGMIIFGIFSDGGLSSSKISLEKSYRYLIVFLAPIYLNNQEKIKKFLFLSSFSVIISFVNGMYIYKMRNWNFNFRYESFARVNDISHMMAAFSVIILGYIIYLYKNKKIKEVIYYMIVYTLAITQVLLTQTRGAWLGIIAGIIIFFLILDWKKLIVGIMISSVLAFSVGKTDFYKNNRYIKRFVSIKDINDDSPKIRLILWEGCADIYKKNMIFGVGRDNLPKHMLKYLEENKKYDEVYSKWQLKEIAIAGNPHSMYFVALVEEGIGGFLLYIFWAYILISEFLFLRKNKERKMEFYILLGCLSATISLYITGLTEDSWRSFWRGNMYLTVYILYLGMKKYMLNKEIKEIIKGRDYENNSI